MAYRDIKPYSDLAHNASINGGPQKYIEDIEKFNFLKGHTEGFKKGIGVGGVLTTIVLGGIACGKVLWDKHKIKVEKEKELEEKAKNAKEILTQTELKVEEE